MIWQSRLFNRGEIGVSQLPCFNTSFSLPFQLDLPFQLNGGFCMLALPHHNLSIAHAALPLLPLLLLLLLWQARVQQARARGCGAELDRAGRMSATSSVACIAAACSRPRHSALAAATAAAGVDAQQP
jgi:hypothetical protein